MLLREYQMIPQYPINGYMEFSFINLPDAGSTITVFGNEKQYKSFEEI